MGHTINLVRDPAKREDFVGTPPAEPPIVPTLSRLSANPLPSLGDRFSSINLAHAGLQYFKDRAQSACEAYLPSPLRSVIAAPGSSANAPMVATQAQNSGHECVQPMSLDSACTEEAEPSGSDELPLPTDKTVKPYSVTTNVSSVPLDPSTLNVADHSTDGALPAAPSDPSVPIRLTASMEDPLVSAPSLDFVPAVFLSLVPPLAISGASLDVPSAVSPIFSDSSLAPADDSYGGFAPGITASCTLAVNTTEASDATMNAGDDTIPTQAHNGLATSDGNIPAAVCATSPAEPNPSETPVLLLDFNTPAARLEIAVANDAPADGEAHVPPDAEVPLSDNEGHARLTEDFLPLLPQPSEGDAAPTMPTLQSKNVAFSDTVPLESVTVALPVTRANRCPGALVAVLDVPGETIPDIDTETLSDKSTVPSDALLMPVDERSSSQSGRASADVASPTIETIPLGDMADVCDGERPGNTQGGSGIAATGTLEDCPARSPATSEGVVGQESSASVDEDAMHLDVSEIPPVPPCQGPGADDNGKIPASVDVGGSEAGCTAYVSGSETDTPVSLLSGADHSTAIDDEKEDQSVHTVEAIAEDPQIPNGVTSSPASPPYNLIEDTYVRPPTPGMGFDDTLDRPSKSSLLLDDHDPAPMQVGEQQPLDPSEDIARDDSDPVESFSALSSPFPPSSPPYLSSPLRSSSPPFAFSSPVPNAFNSSPPTSPAPSPPRRKAVTFQLDKEPGFRNEVVARSAQKRALEDIDDSDDAGNGWLSGSEYTAMSDEREAKRIVRPSHRSTARLSLTRHSIQETRRRAATHATRYPITVAVAVASTGEAADVRIATQRAQEADRAVPLAAGRQGCSQTRGARRIRQRQDQSRRPTGSAQAGRSHAEGELAYYRRASDA